MKKSIAFLFILLTACSQSQADSTPTPSPPKKVEKSQDESMTGKTVTVTIQVLHPDGSPVDGVGFEYQYIKPDITMSTIGRISDVTNAAGQFTLDLEEGATVKIRAGKAEKIIQVSRQETFIEIKEP